jgi:hypothetical protein
MKISIEMEAEDWLSLAAILHCFMGMAVENMANNPIAYSNAARITNIINKEVGSKVPEQVLDEVIKRTLETGSSFKIE